MSIRPTDVITVSRNGKTFRIDRASWQGFLKAEDRFRKRYGRGLVVVQGGFNKGGVAASAGTHDGGALDVRVWDLTGEQRRAAVWYLRKYGCFAAHQRYRSQGFSEDHIHATQVGNRTLSSGAAWQVDEYRAGRNGLASRGRDTARRPKPIRAYKFDYPKALPKPKPPVKVVDRRIDQVWHVKRGEEARFRAGPSAGAKVLTIKKSGNFRFDQYAIEEIPGEDRKWLRLKSVNPRKKWVNANVMDKGRS